jgi:hypothetical protein
VIVAAGWGLLVCGLLANAWARRRDNELLEGRPEDDVARHERISRLQIGGIGLGLVAFLGLGRGGMALSVALAVLGASALGAALVRVQLPGPEGLRPLLAAELAASWALYAGVGMVLWG